ncbi:RHS repeat-associated core domain-containing protein [Gemmatimonas sp.]|uniref:RHS repeat-associated core domain-containing protein n=1 Tax=Gemmatimonas sp. TaxID=1962908 RepID=UPI0039831107
MYDAKGFVTRTVYHSGLGVLAATESADGVLQQFRYDGFGRPRESLSPACSSGACPFVDAAKTTSYAADVGGRPGVAFGVVISQVGAPTSRVFFDSLLRVVRTETQLPDGRFAAQESTYHPDFWSLIAEHRVATADSAAPTWLRTAFTYDRAARVTRVQRDDLGAPAVTTREYAGNQVTTTGPTGAVTRTAVDGEGRLVLSERYDGYVPGKIFDISKKWMTTRYAYGPFSQLARVVDSAGNLTRIVYDRLGRRTWMSDPDAGEQWTEYDAFSNVVRTRNALGTDTEYRFDSLGRPTGRSAPDGLACITWDAGEGAIGKVAATVYTPKEGDAVMQRNEYDSLGRPRTHHQQIGSGPELAAAWDYDVHGRLARTHYPGALSVAYEYSFGHQTGVVDDTGSPLWRLTGNDVVGHLVDEMSGDGLSTHHAYDGVSQRPVQSTISDGAGRARDELGFGWYRDGKLKRRTQRYTRGDALPLSVTKVEDFLYDHIRRLQRWSGDVTVFAAKGPVTKTSFDSSYSYDGIGNLAARTTKGADKTVEEDWVSGPSGDAVIGAPPHAVIRGPKGSYGYDAAGRQTTAPGRDTTWTTFDKPQSIGGAGGTSVVLDYAADLTRVRKRSSDGFAATTYLLGGLYEQRLVGPGKTEVFTVATPGSVTVQILRSSGEPPQVLYLHNDRLGSPHVITNAGGTVLERPAREPFGQRVQTENPTRPATSTLPVTVGFTGHEEEAELALVNMRGRSYDPSVGRFTSPDPVIASIGNPQDLNRFAYAMNDPVNVTDPSGMTANDAGGWEVSLNPLAILALLFGPPGSASAPTPVGIKYTWGAGNSGNVPTAKKSLTPRRVPFLPIITAQVAVGAEGGMRVERLPGYGPEFATSVRETFNDLPRFQFNAYMRQTHWREAEMEARNAEFQQYAFVGTVIASSFFWPAWLARAAAAGVAAHAAASTPSDSVGDPLPNMLAMVPGIGLLPRGLGPAGRGYEVVASIELPPIGAPGHLGYAPGRAGHFKTANTMLLDEMAGDAELAGHLGRIDPDLGSKLAAAGVKSPAGYTWHHALETPNALGGSYGRGVLELVHRPAHISAAGRPLFHPGGFGGFYQWGSSY